MIPEPPQISRLSARLLRRARGGEREAYDQLFALATDRVLLYIRVRLEGPLRMRVDPLDVLQETYLEAHRSFDRFEDRGERSFTRWLCRIAERTLGGLRDHHRARKRRPPRRLLTRSTILRNLRASGVDPRTVAERREELERLRDALSSLEPPERKALLLRYFQERTIDEIAAEIGKSATSVRRLLGRATARLGERLGSKDPKE